MQVETPVWATPIVDTRGFVLLCQEIKAAYRALAKICHPDFTGDRGHNMCILLNEAYSVLMDDQQRTIYDQQLDTALQDEEDGYTGVLLAKDISSLHFLLITRVEMKSRHCDCTAVTMIDRTTLTYTAQRLFPCQLLSVFISPSVSVASSASLPRFQSWPQPLVWGF